MMMMETDQNGEEKKKSPAQKRGDIRENTKDINGRKSVLRRRRRK